MITTLGNQPSGEDGAAIYDLNSGGVLTHEFNLSEQGNHNLPVTLSTGETVIGGSDAALGDDWTFGNIYVKDLGVWSKKRTLENVLHVFGVTEHNNKLYVGTGAHIGDNSTWEARVYWSDDVGDTWNYSYVCYYRVRDLISFEGNLFAVCHDSPNYKLYKSEDNGITWSLFVGVTPSISTRTIIYSNKLYIVNNTGNSIYVIDDNDNVSSVSIPTQMSIPASACNFLAVSNGNLYILCGNNNDKIYRLNEDNTTWTYHCELQETCCSLINFEDQFLIASTLGTNAKLLKIPV